MSTPEHLHLTRIRVATETALGSGLADATGWVTPPCTGAAISRELVTSASRVDVFNQTIRKEILASSWIFRTAHEVGTAWLLWLLKPHMTSRPDGVWTLDPEAAGPSFTVETTSEAGDIAHYIGARILEIQITWQERRIVVVEITWGALHRETPGAALPGGNGPDLWSPMVPTRLASMAAVTGPWDPAPRATQRKTMHGGQLILTRELRPANYGPDGRADQFSEAPWVVMAEVLVPETANLTGPAFGDEWTGRIAFWFGDGPEHIRINAGHGFIQDEDLLAYDWRVRNLAVQGMSDYRRALAELHG